MAGHNLRTVFHIACIEYNNLIKSTKIVILGIFLIFMNIQIIIPLKNCSVMMDDKLSFLEPFVAAGNSGAVVLILPLFFLAMMADFPRQDGITYFFQIRCSKKTWIMGQIFFAIISCVSLILFTLAASILLLIPYGKWTPNFSKAITTFLSVYPERSKDYVVELLPENLYHQMSLKTAVLDTSLLLMLYCLVLALVLLFFSLINKKLIGILLDGFLITGGAILCAARSSYMWFFPMSHTITWLHYTEYFREEIFPMMGSYLYLGLTNIIFIILCLFASKYYHVV